MKKSISLLFLFLILLPLYSIYYPELTGRVVDKANVLNSNELTSLEKRLEQYDNKTNNQMAICFIDTTYPYEIEEYSIRLAEKWKIGYKGRDNGIIMLFAMKDRKMRIEVGYGLEGDLTDLEAKLLIERILVPHFKKGKYFEGIIKAIDYIEKETGESYSKEDIITKKLQPKVHKLWVDKKFQNIFLTILLVLGILLAILFNFFISDKIHFIFPLINFITIVLYILFFSFIFKMPNYPFFALLGIGTLGFVIGLGILEIIYPTSGSSYTGGGTSSYDGYSSNSSYSNSSYSGGGGSFGGGGASGSW